MRIPRIHHPAVLTTGERIALDDNAANHVARVLRLQTGAPLILFNGEGGEYAATLIAVGKRRVEVEIGAFRAREVESPLSITLAQGVAKGDRMDYTVQKAVELGVSRIIPVVTERCAVRMNEERWDKKVRHWQAVAISACEQCGRNRIPVITDPVSLQELLDQPAHGLRLTLDPQADGGFADLEPPQAAITLLIGPEGGLSDCELAAAHKAGYHGLRLGPRVLRTETAGMAALALLQSRWGDI